MVNWFIYYKLFYGLVIALSIIECNKRDPNLYSNQLVISAQPGPKVNTGTTIADTSHYISLYLTFDDGPSTGSETVNSLAITDSIKINVFIIGKFVFRNDTGMKRFMAYRNNPFIEIGNHTFTHANSHHYHLYYENTAKVVDDFLVNYDSLHLVNKIGRLPGRNCWRIGGKSRNDLADAVKAADSLATFGYKIFGWDMEWRCDSLGKVNETAADLAGRIHKMAIEENSFTPCKIVILCHDPMLSGSYNVLQLKELINTLKAQKNYRFEFLSDYSPTH